MTALKLKNLVKRYGDFTAVSDLSLEVPTGSIYGFLGPNGAGKTTTIRMILDIVKPSSGDIAILHLREEFFTVGGEHRERLLRASHIFVAHSAKVKQFRLTSFVSLPITLHSHKYLRQIRIEMAPSVLLNDS